MSIFACPVCGLPLQRTETACLCPAGHSFDIASEGYVYLLQPNRKHSKVPGDDRKMVAARRRFLEGGYYRIFSDALSRLAEKYLPPGSPAVLDAGCGEGYYTGRLAGFLSSGGHHAELSGFDISKAAVKAAAKKYKNISFAVGSAFSIPVLSASADLLTDVFAPIVPEEFARVVKPGGTMILAVPSRHHLYGLKEILYEKPYENEQKDTEYPGFTFLGRVPVRGKLEMDSQEAIRDLFAMTPYAWKTPWEGRQHLERLTSLRTEIGFDYLLYRRV